MSKPTFTAYVYQSHWRFDVVCHACNQGYTMTQCSLHVESLVYVCSCGKAWTLRQNGKITRKYKVLGL